MNTPALSPDVVEFLRLAASAGKLTQREAAAILAGEVAEPIRVERDPEAPAAPAAARVRAVMIGDRVIALDDGIGLDAKER